MKIEEIESEEARQVRLTNVGEFRASTVLLTKGNAFETILFRSDGGEEWSAESETIAAAQEAHCTAVGLAVSITLGIQDDV